MELTKSNVMLVNTHSSDRQIIANNVAKAQNLGIYVAQSIVNRWFDDYSEFFYDKESGLILFYHLKTRGYWEINNENIKLYK